LNQFLEWLEVAEGGWPDLHPVRLVRPVGDEVEDQLTTRALHEGIDITDRPFEPLTHQPEVVDDRLHARAQLAPWWQGDLAIVGQPWARWKAVNDLLQDLQALAHLLDANPVAVITVAVRAEGHLELVLLIATVGEGFADVVVDAGGSQ